MREDNRQWSVTFWQSSTGPLLGREPTGKEVVVGLL
jgi:hypothetical protein